MGMLPCNMGIHKALPVLIDRINQPFRVRLLATLSLPVYSKTYVVHTLFRRIKMVSFLSALQEIIAITIIQIIK